MHDQSADDEPMPGRPAFYRPKEFQLTVKLTKRGHDTLGAACRRHGKSPSDVFENLLRQHAKDITFPPPVETE